MPALGLGLGLPFTRPSGGGGLPPLDLSGLNVRAYYHYGIPETVWADTARTVPATDGGAILGLTDLSGNNNHATLSGIGPLWIDGCLWAISERNHPTAYSNTIKIPSLNWNPRNITLVRLYEPIAHWGNANTTAWHLTDPAGSTMILFRTLPSTGNGAPIYTWISASPAVITAPSLSADRQAYSIRCNGTNTHFLVGETATTVAQVQANVNVTGLHIGGAPPIDNNAHNHYIERCTLVLDGTVSASRLLQLHQDLKNQWTNVHPTRTLNYFVSGDSITQGWGATLQPYWRQLSATNPNIRWWVGAMGGLQATSATGPYAPEPGMPAMDHKILWIGWNDCYQNKTASAIQTAIGNWITSYGAPSYTVCTIAPEFALTAPQLAVKNAVNAWIASTYPSNYLDLDTAGIIANSGSGDFRPFDQVHLSAQGHRKVAIVVANKLGLNPPPAL